MTDGYSLHVSNPFLPGPEKFMGKKNEIISAKFHNLSLFCAIFSISFVGRFGPFGNHHIEVEIMQFFLVQSIPFSLCRRRRRMEPDDHLQDSTQSSQHATVKRIQIALVFSIFTSKVQRRLQKRFGDSKIYFLSYVKKCF